MPELTGVKWEVDVKCRIKRIEIDTNNLNVTLYGEREHIKSGVITKADFEAVKKIVEKILQEA